MWLLAVALLGQSVGIGGYVLNPQTPDALLAMPEGRYQILRFGPECNFVDASQNFEVVWGNRADEAGDVGAVLVTDDGQRCGVLTGDLVDPTPCATNADGDCDVAAEKDQ